MKVLLLGHSYVYYLKLLGDWNRKFVKENGQEVDLEFSFRWRSGKDYQWFLDEGQDFEYVKEIKPDIIVVILGGNSIVNSVSNTDIRDKAIAFFQKLKEVVEPESIIIATQVEPRFYEPGNRFDCPEPEEFNRRRQRLNLHLNQKVKKKGLLKHIIAIPTNVFTADFYRDGIHLNLEGMQLYQNAINGGLDYALNHQ